LHTEHTTAYDFLSSACPVLFGQICGQQIALTSVWSTTKLSRYYPAAAASSSVMVEPKPQSLRDVDDSIIIYDALMPGVGI